MKYYLEIFQPDVMDVVWMKFESDTPFLTISKGDILNPYDFSEAEAGKLLRVVSLEHFLTAFEHKLYIYTEQIDDNEDVRLDP
ncbi:MAG: hypothetical protein QOF94_81 [Acidobacteriaceae bacterium]|jgi:hypothetical protein